LTARLTWYDSVARNLSTIIPNAAHAEASKLSAQVAAQVAGKETGALRDDIASPKFTGLGRAYIGSDLPYAARHNYEHNNFLAAASGSFVAFMMLGLRKRYP
jgi:hypothetical protein